MRIVFFGNERIASGITLSSTPVLTSLIAAHDVVAVVSHHTESLSRNQRSLEVAAVVDAHQIPLFLPSKPADILPELQNLKPDIGVLVAYGKIIPQSLIDLFPHGIINLHPSLLPLYRGPIPIEQALLNGDTQTGVSIMQLSREMDAGPVYKQLVYPLNGTETKQALAETLLQKGAEVIVRLLPQIEQGVITPRPQDETQASYCSLLTKEHGYLQPESKPAEVLEREIRAFAGWPKSRITIQGHQIIVTKAHVSPDDSGPLTIACQDQTYLAIDELITPSGKKTSAEAFRNGYLK